MNLAKIKMKFKLSLNLYHNKKKNDYRIEFAQQTISWLPKTIRRLERKNEDEDYDYSSSIVAKMKNVCLEEE